MRALRPVSDLAIRSRRRSVLGLLLAAVVFGFVVAPASAQDGARRKPDERRGYFGPQLDRTGAGSVVMSWARPVGEGHDLLFARRTADGGFEEARRLNAEPGTVSWLPLDEARPVLVTGPQDEVGAVWFDAAGHVHAALSANGGRDFAGPFVVDDGPGRRENAFAAAAFDRDGAMFVAWLDARHAPANMEEPAHVFLARVDAEGAAPEVDLTSAHTASVCGCCRPAITIDRGEIEVLFRNAGEDGWRDVHRLRGRWGQAFDEFERVGPATWKIDACPMSGPIAGSTGVLWCDGSKGHTRVVQGTTPTAPLRVVLDAGRPRWNPRSPRWIDRPDGEPLLLVPGDPSGRVLRADGGTWNVVVDEVPAWCNSAVVLEGQLLMVGDDHGRLRLEALDVTW